MIDTNHKIVNAPYYNMKELDIYPEVENLDIPGVDNFSHYEDEIYYCWQPALPIENAYGIKGHTGRWVITNNLTNPLAAYIAYYNGDYFRIDQALEKYKKELNESKG